MSVIKYDRSQLLLPFSTSVGTAVLVIKADDESMGREDDNAVGLEMVDMWCSNSGHQDSGHHLVCPI